MASTVDESVFLILIFLVSFLTSCRAVLLGWIDFFEKCEFQIVWGLKSCVLVPRYHIQNIIELFWRLTPPLQKIAKNCKKLQKICKMKIQDLFTL
jgi:hypothetical protein